MKAVNDYIVSQTAYTSETKSSPHSAYTVLAERGGVCQGYALLAHSMLQKLGIETQYIVGYVGEVGHAWNLVKLGGQWYHFDTTWNDPVPDRKGAVRYQYFLVDDRTMARIIHGLRRIIQKQQARSIAIITLLISQHRLVSSYFTVTMQIIINCTCLIWKQGSPSV